ncbi:hypothetical protein GN244_ATG00153 [Phytophthora infestans]|uniref:Uncharacterized protein n=1 Tax=Phytophthora infestans TaxID=4787 RepID=A0A833WNZ9_PHYIN|nr:hypothetical protein GN244_ATG00153 [Phytophthora infestans]KAF4142781.1 hypothetical protein GN958_ATG08009 [Phytophthora infestans]
MSSRNLPERLGLRNWRGEIIQPGAATIACDTNEDSLTGHGSTETEQTSPPSDDRHSGQKKVLRKDEFGRDLEVVVNKTHRKKFKEAGRGNRKRERKHKHKGKHKHHRDENSDRSRSASPCGRLIGTPPPADPFRPQLDQDRGRHSHHRTHYRSRSRSHTRRSKKGSRRHSRSREDVKPRTDDHRRRSHRRFFRSRSRSRSQNRNRSPSSLRSRRRCSSASKWTHNAFNDRSQSPPRLVDPLYQPESETWVSRAGGVYLPRI